MSAIHQFSESNGSGEVETVPISNLNFGSNDSPNLNTLTYPIIRGNSSFEKYLRCIFTDVYTEISNMKFWKSSGDLKTGETINVQENVGYATPSDVANGDVGCPGSVGNALEIQSAEGASTIVYGASGVSGYTKYLRMQLRTTGSTPGGAVNQKEFTFQYDEI